jgi:hypothetical protein
MRPGFRKPPEHPPERVIYGMAAEKGDFQDIPLPGDIPLPAAGLTLSVASDLEPVPEPSTLALASVGGLALAASIWRRRRPWTG